MHACSVTKTILDPPIISISQPHLTRFVRALLADRLQNSQLLIVVQQGPQLLPHTSGMLEAGHLAGSWSAE